MMDGGGILEPVTEVEKFVFREDMNDKTLHEATFGRISENKPEPEEAPRIDRVTLVTFANDHSGDIPETLQ